MKNLITAILVIVLGQYITLFIYLGYISDKINNIEWFVNRYKGKHEE